MCVVIQNIAILKFHVKQRFGKAKNNVVICAN